MTRHEHHEPAPFLSVLLLFFGLVAVAPGALVILVADEALGLGLAPDQHWAWAYAASAAILVALRLAVGGWWHALGRYAQASLVVVAFVAFCRCGLHAEWPRSMMSAFFGR